MYLSGYRAILACEYRKANDEFDRVWEDLIFTMRDKVLHQLALVGRLAER